MRLAHGAAMLVLIAGSSCRPATPAGGSAPGRADGRVLGSSWPQAGGGPGRDRSVDDPGPGRRAVLLWSALTDLQVATEPVHVVTPAGERVVVAVASGLRAFDVGDGHELWTAELGGGVTGAPAVRGARLLAPTLAGRAFLLDGEDGRVLGLREFDFPLEAPALRVGEAFALEETSVSGRDGRSRLHVLEADATTPRWTRDFEAGGGVAPAAEGELLFVHAHDGLRAWRLSGGEPAWRWRRPRHRQVVGPVVAGGRVVVHSSPRPPGGSLTALDAATGRVLWELELSSRLVAAPALSSDELVGTAWPDRLQSRSAATGELRWEVVLPARSEVAPVLTPGRVLVAGLGHASAFDRATGAELWSLPLEGEAAALAVVGERLFVATFDGFLHCLGPAP